MALHEQLHDGVNKEKGGRHGGKGHDFQRYWALCHLLEVDLSKDDFVILLEFIEDIALVDSSSLPTTIQLYQLKKKASGKWSITNLTKAEKDEKLSVLGKIFSSRKIVGSHCEINFVSNAPVNLKLNNEKLKSEDLDKISAETLSEEVKNIILDCASKQIECPKEEISLLDFNFIKTNLSINDLERHSLGILNDYLVKKFPDHTIRADVLLKALYYEISAKITNTQDTTNFSELQTARGINKSGLYTMLSSVSNTKTHTEIMAIALEEIKSEATFPIRREIKLESNRFLIDLSSKNNLILDKLLINIDKASQLLPSTLSSCWDMASWILSELKKMDSWRQFMSLNEKYIISAILYELNK